MSSSNYNKKAVAMRYTEKDNAPVIVASGLGYIAEKMVEVATDNNIPVYEDTSLTTVLSQLKLGQEIPPELYNAIIEIYVYFLKFDPSRQQQAQQAQAQQTEPPAPQLEYEEVEADGSY